MTLQVFKFKCCSLLQIKKRKAKNKIKNFRKAVFKSVFKGEVNDKLNIHENVRKNYWGVLMILMLNTFGISAMGYTHR